MYGIKRPKRSAIFLQNICQLLKTNDNFKRKKVVKVKNKSWNGLCTWMYIV